MHIEHRLLGTIVLNNRKAIALLAYLLLEADQPHRRTFLLGLLWPDLPTAAAQNNLRVTWAYLQKALKTSTADDHPLLIGDRLTLRLNAQSDFGLDIAHFRALLEACRMHPHPSPEDCSECAERLTQALALVRGDFLDQFSLGDCVEFDEWLLVQREHFRVQVMAALEQLAAFHERAGQLAEAEHCIRRLLAYDPLRESAYRQLMRVLASADQLSGALDTYETCRRMLATELGLAPTIETMTLAAQIRARVPAEAHATQAALPPVLTRFFGRQNETARVAKLLSGQEVQLVSLVGFGGVGKTRLALEVAHRLNGLFAHGICLVELAGVAHDSSVDDAVAAALHLPTTDSRSPASVIVDYVRDKTMLLVLDNCEHLVKACARLVETLCQRAAGLIVLATSRIPLRLEQEQVVRVEPFTLPAVNGGEALTAAASLDFDAIQLFTNRAAQSLLQFTLTDANVGAVARICHHLDGLPQAIEIAAAQTRALPLETMAERLDQRFTWRNRRVADPTRRHRTLHTLIDWSYSLLSAPERAMLRRLAVFAGGWTLEAAEAVGVPGESTAALLAELVDHSLVVFGADTERRRYNVHETIRQFAQEQLHGSEQEPDAFQRHARYYADMVARAVENKAGHTLPERLRMLEHDHDNLQQALDWMLRHDRERALALVAQLGTELNFWELGGYFQEGRRWLTRALDGSESSVSLERAQALLAAADLSSAIADFDYGLQCARQAQELFLQLGEQHGEIDARLEYYDLAKLAGTEANLEAQVEAVLDRAEALAYIAGIAKAKLLLGSLAYHAANDRVAVHYLLSSIALLRTLNRPFDLASALNLLAGALLALYDHAAAGSAYEESRDIYQSLGYRRGVALLTQNLGVLAQELGDYPRARALFCEGLRIRRDLGLQRGYAYSFEFIARVDQLEERYERALQLWAASDALRTRIGAPLEQAIAEERVTALAKLRARFGDVAYELEWSKGAAMTTEQAITLALS